MLRAKDFRQRAWSALSGKWGTMVVIALIVSVIMGACEGLSLIGVGTIALLLITGPLSLGVVMATLKVIRGQNVEIGNVFDGFKNFGNAFLLSLINGILISLWSLLFIIPGIIKSYSYGMSFYILADNPNMDANSARKASMQLMNGNKWRLFCLDFSYIGWYLLCGLTLGILTFWVTPYHEAARAAFYQDLIDAQSGYNGNNGGFNGNVNNGYGNANSQPDEYAQNTSAYGTGYNPNPDMELGAPEKAEERPANDNGGNNSEPPLNADDL